MCLLNSPPCEEGRAQVLRGASEVQPRPPDAVPLPPLGHHGQRTASHSLLILCRNYGGEHHIKQENEDGGLAIEASKQICGKTDRALIPLSCLIIGLWALAHKYSVSLNGMILNLPFCPAVLLLCRQCA